jgi:hypothetical protein
MRLKSSFRAALIAAIWAMLIGSGSPLAQEMDKGLQPGLPARPPVEGDWTVVTMAPDGSLGVATAMSAGQALSQAIRNCRTISREVIGCGAQSKFVRAGWIVALRCGATNIIAAGASLGDVEQAAAERQAELRRLYAPDLPPCRRVLTVDPEGGMGMSAS